MLFVLSVIPLVLGIAIVILALIRKMKPQAVAQRTEKPAQEQ